MNEVVANQTSGHLQTLVQLLIQLADQRGVTPVLVIDRRWVLADEFYVSLCHQCTACTGRPVRFDLLPGHGLGIVDPSPRWWWRWLAAPRLPVPLARVAAAPLRGASIRRLARRLAPRATVEPAVAVSRPGGPLRELVVGLAGPADELPRFAQEIILGPVAA